VEKEKSISMGKHNGIYFHAKLPLGKRKI